ncbi:MAG: hypothetical protein ACK5LC_13045 [Coprobacillaceae bacterium]
MNVTKLLVEKGINVNGRDKNGAIPLQYLITANKLTTKELLDTFKYLLKCKSDYKNINNYGKSCLDYAGQFSWRNDFLYIVEEYENE